MDLDLKIENVTAGFRNYGYHVTSEPMPGCEAVYYAHLQRGLRKVEEAVDFLHRTAHCRGKSKRTLEMLHRCLPEPCWGVRK